MVLQRHSHIYSSERDLGLGVNFNQGIYPRLFYEPLERERSGLEPDLLADVKFIVLKHDYD